MKSHFYEFNLGELGPRLGGPIIPMILVAVVLRLGAGLGWLPGSWPATNVDQTILTHQAAASRSASDADVVLVGDSSCLMNVSGKYLEERLAGDGRVINLGSLSYLGFSGFASLLTRFASVNAGHVRHVVVLVHPEMLRGIDPAAFYRVFLSNFYADEDPGDSATVIGQLRGLMGLDIALNRLVSRLPLSLPGRFGQYYGFNLDLDRYMDQQHGSVVDPHTYTHIQGQGNAEYRLAPMWQTGCQALKAAVPLSARLIIGLTPIPQSFAPAGHAERAQRILAEWAAWMQADSVLTQLPATMPDFFFAGTTHLNETGAVYYTRILEQCLQPLMALHSRQTTEKP